MVTVRQGLLLKARNTLSFINLHPQKILRAKLKSVLECTPLWEIVTAETAQNRDTEKDQYNKEPQGRMVRLSQVKAKV